MSLIEMGLDFKTAQKQAEKASLPAPNGRYNLQCLAVDTKDANGEVLKTGKGQAKARFTLSIVGNADPELNGKKLYVNANLPDNGNFTGVIHLVNLLNAMKRTWQGSGFETTSCIGATLTANLVVSKDGKWNEIESY